MTEDRIEAMFEIAGKGVLLVAFVVFVLIALPFWILGVFATRLGVVK